MNMSQNAAAAAGASGAPAGEGTLFTRQTQAIFWNNHQTAIQRMLDYDTLIGRDTPSVAAIVSPTSGSRFGKFFFGSSELLIPICKSTADAVVAHTHADVLLQLRLLPARLAHQQRGARYSRHPHPHDHRRGHPGAAARAFKLRARQLGKLVIGPATVGDISPGAIKVANTGGTLENIIASKLHRAGSCGLVTRSGGLFKELAHTIALNADGISEGVAIGGDRFAGSGFLEHLLRMQANPAVKYLLLLGEVGVLMVDMWRGLDYSEEDIDQFIDSGTLNAFFVLGRSIGFIGQILDEKRLNVPMYRHPYDDILCDVSAVEGDRQG